MADHEAINNMWKHVLIFSADAAAAAAAAAAEPKAMQGSIFSNVRG